ncbi:MAG TPA: hypothetical protein VHO70_10060, partial [Chitinispirillaceae bacterium]|nr:hypothetical protein [Chitinispirillaceae bacterium]
MNQKENLDIENCISTLKKLSENGAFLADLPEELKKSLYEAAGRISRPDRYEAKKRNKEIKQEMRRKIAQKDRNVRANSGIRTARDTDVFVAPLQIAGLENNDELKNPQTCYICHKEYTSAHFFYDALCPECAEFNYRKRFQSAPLHGKVVIITGSRVKIGYQSTLMLLKAGAHVVATTRFPVDSAMRFSREKDFHE